MVDNWLGLAVVYGGFNFDGGILGMRFRVVDVLSWALTVLVVVLVIWRVFGDSPSEWAVAGGIVGILVVKMFNVSERMTRLEMGTRNGFCNMKKDMKIMRERIEGVENRLDKKVDLVLDKLGGGYE